MAPSDAAEKNRNMGAQLPSLVCITASKIFRKIYFLWKRHSDNLDTYQLYCDCANLCRSSLQNFDNVVESGIVESNNLGIFYRYVNKRMKHRSSIAAVNDKAGNLVVNDSDKANLFNNYFSTVGVVDNGVIPSHVNPLMSLTALDSVVFNRSAVCNAISKLKSNLSSGPDGLPPVLFKQLKHCLA